MKQLKAFILGMLTILLFIPLVEQIAEVLITGLEYIKGLFTKSVLTLNKDLVKLQSEQSEVDTHVMGFDITTSDDYDFDDDDLEDKKKSRNFKR